MPELPEVETIRRSLQPLVVGRRIETVEIRCGKLRRPLSDDFARQLSGRSLCSTSRRAKYLLLELDDGKSWIVHLGMSGQLLHRRAGAVAEARVGADQAVAEGHAGKSGDDAAVAGKHDHVVVYLDDGASLVFRDPRRFGLMLVDDARSCTLFAGIGPEPFDRAVFNGEYLKRLGRRTRRSVKDVLMDQRAVAGLGNIYVNEALFACGLRPRRRLAGLTRAQCGDLTEACRQVLGDAIAHKGSSISDFLDGIGRRGAYQWKHRVYNRAGKPCQLCRTEIKAVVVGGRSSFYCPNCQH